MPVLGPMLAALALGSAAPAQIAPSSPPATAASAAAPALTPEQMYLRSMKVMKSEAVPPFVQFHETVQMRNLRIACDEKDATLAIKHGDTEFASLVSFRSEDGEAVSVDQTTGKRCRFTILYPAGSALNTLDTVKPSPGATATPDATAQSDGLKLVGAVRVESAASYKITLAGTEMVDGHQTYHLALKAYRDPLSHPLTDLWIDPDTYLVRQARGEASAHFVVGSGRFEGTLTYDRIGGYWIVHSEDFSAAGNALLIHVRTHLAASGTDFTFPDDLPGIFPTPSPTPTRSAKP
jgi:hypothetical protein